MLWLGIAWMCCRPEVMHFWQTNELAENTEPVVINGLPLIHLRTALQRIFFQVWWSRTLKWTSQTRWLLTKIYPAIWTNRWCSINIVHMKVPKLINCPGFLFCPFVLILKCTSFHGRSAFFQPLFLNIYNIPLICFCVAFNKWDKQTQGS